MISEKYRELEERYAELQNAMLKRGKWMGFFRLVALVGAVMAGYYAYKMGEYGVLGWVVALGIACFAGLMFIHAGIREKAKYYGTLAMINRRELGYLSGDISNFDGGDEFVNAHHAYTFDLDFFGAASIFQHLNRTTTSLGKGRLASLIEAPEAEGIGDRQEAIRELSQKLDWRQGFQAAGLLDIGKDGGMREFMGWTEKPTYYLSRMFWRVERFALPIGAIAALAMTALTDNAQAFPIFKLLAIANLVVVATQQRRIKEEWASLETVADNLEQYKRLMGAIEKEEFSASLLRRLQSGNGSDSVPASRAIGKLTGVLHRFDNISNPIGAIVMNGLFQYHIHALFALEEWKREYAGRVAQWLGTVGEFEALSSVANFGYNHPDFIYPALVGQREIEMRQVGHPLIGREKRVCNDLDFKENSRFVVLTGSNMSGKSTFLRTLGVNLVLAEMGSPVCAERFSFYPFTVLASMRMSDSLQDNESFFFAELKRLQGIVRELEAGKAVFVILDEILRGTNSNDKRAGTRGLIRNLIGKDAVGIIATHDLVISEMTGEYPGYLSAKCFEVEIADDELHFDYRLRDGVCQHLSAAFLMTKMGIM